MEFHYFEDYPSMSAAAARGFHRTISEIQNPFACLATGNSPLGMYRELAASGRDYSRMHIVKLDEWLGLPMDHPATCESFLRREVIAPLRIPENQFISFQSNPADPDAECQRIQRELNRLGPLDICVLGLGRNGHIGLNEPGDSPETTCHCSMLSGDSRDHQMLREGGARVTHGLTLGVADILGAGKILLLVAGEGKQKVFEQFGTGQIRPSLPASFLWRHPGVEVFVHPGPDW